MGRTAGKTGSFLKENFFFLVLVLLASVVATSDWKGEAGIPVNLGTDIGFHAYSTWFSQHKIQTGKPFDLWGFDFFTNSIFARTYPPFFYFLSGILAVFAGVWNSIAILVFFSYLLLGMGVFVLARQLGLQGRFAFLASLAAVFSFPLAFEARIWGSVTRVFAYSLLPWLLYCLEKTLNGKTQGESRMRFFAALVLILAFSFLTHPLTGVYFALILAAWAFLSNFFGGKTVFSSGSAKTILLAVLLSGLISSFFFLPLAFERNETELSRYLSPSLASAGVKEAFSSLTSPKIFNVFEGGNATISIYLGLSLVFLLAAFLFSEGRKPPGAKNAAALFFVFFLITLLPWIFAPLNQTLSRPAFFASFFLALAAAFGARFLEKRLANSLGGRSFPIFLAIIVITAVLFIDLNPALIPKEENYGFPLDPSVAYYYLTLQYHPGVGRVVTAAAPMQDDAVVVASSGQTTLYDPPERLNPEYASFITGFGFSNGTIAFQNKAVLLDVGFIVHQMSNTAAIEDYNGGMAGFVGKGFLLNFTTVGKAEGFFETLVSSPSFKPVSAVFILPKTKPYAPDLVFDERNSSLALPATSGFSAVPFQVVFDERNGEARFVPLESGFAFVSLMHYPLWKAYSSGRELKVLEAGGGLIAVEGVEKGEQVVLKFEKPWYDYAGIALSILGLAVLAFITMRKQSGRNGGLFEA